MELTVKNNKIVRFVGKSKELATIIKAMKEVATTQKAKENEIR